MATRYKRPPLFSVWRNMKVRCLLPTNSNYPLYGGRGITIDPRWLVFKDFQQDMLNTYKPGLKLDRIDNDKGYSKDNCKWSTDKEQANNRRSSRFVEYRGMRKTLAQWIDTLHLKSSTIRQRIYVYGWSIEKAFTFKGGQIG